MGIIPKVRNTIREIKKCTKKTVCNNWGVRLVGFHCVCRYVYIGIEDYRILTDNYLTQQMRPLHWDIP